MRDINEYEKEYLKSGFEKYMVQYRRKIILEWVEHYNPQKILEIGCGIEPLFQYLPDKEWVIIEPGMEFCSNAEKQLERMHVNGNVIRGFFEDIPDDALKAIDMIICSSLLHEVENPEEILKKIKSICSENTIVHLNVPNANSLHRLIARGMEMIDDVHALSERNTRLQQFCVYDMESFSMLVEKMKMKIIDKGSYFLKPFTHEQMYLMIQQEIIDEKVLEGLYYADKSMYGEYGAEIFINAVI